MYAKMLLRGMIRRLQNWGIDSYMPYDKHEEWHNAEAFFRMLYGSNSSGKTYAGVAEACMHGSGIYPGWFADHNKYPEPIDIWICLWKYEKFWDTHFKYIKEFIGPLIEDTNHTENLVRLKNGRTIRAMSYKAGADAFESTAVAWIYLDEEPPEDVVDACHARIVRMTNGQIVSTITPVNNPQWFTKALMKADKKDSYYAERVTLEDNKSLNEIEKKKFKEGIDDERMYKVRVEGKPVPVAGRPVFDSDILRNMEEQTENPKIAKLTWKMQNDSQSGELNVLRESG